MNRIIAMTGMVALAATALQPALAQEAKPWNVTATVRSFYDDNYNTAPSSGGAPKKSSWGLELSPSGTYSFRRDQTTLDLSGRYGIRYYEDRKQNSADQSLDLDANLNHQITEKQSLSLTESFAIAQEPGVLENGPASRQLRTDGSNLRNTLGMKYAWDNIIERWSGEASYANTFYDYEQTGVGSYSALLDRVEHLLTTVGRYRIFDETGTELLLGYSFGLRESTSNDLLDGTNRPETRNSRSHYFFTGAGHKLTPDLRVNGRVGIQYAEYPNGADYVPTAGLVSYPDSNFGPYVDVSGSWDYLPNSSVQFGIRHSRIATDISTSVDAAATTLYSSLDHEFNPDLKGSLLAQYQHSTYDSPSTTEKLFSAGLNLEWRFHTFISLEGGYNYDRLQSDSALGGRGYDRNRVYLGFKGTW